MAIILNVESDNKSVYCVVKENDLERFQKTSMSKVLIGFKEKYTFYNNESPCVMTPSTYITCMVQNKPTIVEWAAKDEEEVSQKSIFELLKKVYLVDIKLDDIGTTSIVKDIDERYEEHKKSLKFFIDPESYFVPLKEGSENYTRVLMDKIYRYNAPHNFKLIDVERGDVIDKIHMQEGPVNECGVNGWANEDLINIVITRLEAFNNSPYSSVYNTEAIGHLRNAIASLNARTKKRKDEGKEGTSKI